MHRVLRQAAMLRSVVERALGGVAPGDEDAAFVDAHRSRARALVDCLRAIEELRWAFAPETLGQLVTEARLVGTKWGSPEAGRRFRQLEMMLAPTLIRGYCRTVVDVAGRAAYSTTSSGLEILAQTPDEEPPDDDHERDEEQTLAFRQVYLRARDQVDARLSSLPYSTEIGDVAAPSGIPGAVQLEEVTA